MKRPLRVAINGYGRIGRHVLRAWHERGLTDQIEIVAINDLADAATLAHLTRYDSTHGRFATSVAVEDEHLLIAGQRIRVLSQAQPAALPWAQLAVDVVLECTGRFRARAEAAQHLSAGAGRVVIGAAPFDRVDALIVQGINEAQLRPEHRVISSVSCTTHALMPLLLILDAALGLESVMFTEVHAQTSDQPTLDHVHRDLRRARASGHNIVPTTTSALAAVRQLLPELAIEGHSLRVPTLVVAAVELDVCSRRSLPVEVLNQRFLAASQGAYAGILGYTEEPLVSSDFVHQPYSCVFDATQTRQIGQQTRVLAWYDNEWGYANRLLELVQTLAAHR